MTTKFKVLEKAFWSLERTVDKLENELELHKKIAKQSVDTVNQILKEFDEYAVRIEELEKPTLIEYKKPSLYERICQKITLTLLKLKS